MSSAAAAAGVTGVGQDGAYDPYNQTFTITMPDGHTLAAIPLHSVYYLQSIAVQTAIIYGIQLGICVVLLMVLCLMTRPDKRRSAVFILNVICLVALFMRAIMLFLTIGGPLYNFYNWVNGWYPDTPGLNSALAESVAAEVFSFISIAAIEMSMMFQTQIVCCTLSTRWRHAVTAVCFLLALQAITIRFACMVVNAAWVILQLDEVGEAKRKTANNLASAFNISVIISIIFFSAIFCAKLGHAIWQRRKMGMKQFGPMQIIFVMGCQTLLIPVIFGILSYWVLPGAQLQSIMPVVVATFLPLSSLWASTNPSQNNNIAAPQQWRREIHGSTAGGKTNATYDSEKQLLDTNNTNTTDTVNGDTRNPSFSGAASKKYGHQASASRDSIDLEMAKMGHRIKVDRTYSVRSD